MGRIIFISGGARSGKSAFAERLAEAGEGPLLYLATATVLDAEMAERIALHQQRRGPRWGLLEEPYDLAGRLPAAAAGCGGVLVDCVTLWLTNLFLAAEEDNDRVLAEVERFCAVLPQLKAPIFLVSNEVGFGIVPENRMARLFRDLAGAANQRLAAAADEAWLVVSGLPLRLK